jgi:Alpha/beta hydrolase
MLSQAISALGLLVVAVPAWLQAPVPTAPLPPLTYNAIVSPAHPDDVWLLADDPTGDGRRVAVLGNLDAAQHVAVLVPGATQDLTTFDTPLGPLGHARNLYAELRKRAPTTPVAVVAWLGYDTPEGLDRAVVRSERAIAAAPDLLRLSRLLPDAAHVTWICHSYGSVVCGRAAPLAAPDDLVLLASPGTDAPTAAQLGAGQVWAARAPEDPIRFTPAERVGGLGHGADPVDPGFGAQLLDVGGARGHSEYLSPGGTLLRDIATIVLGGAPEVSRG